MAEQADLAAAIYPCAISALDLHHDVLLQMFELLDVRSRCRAACVCSRWTAVLRQMPDSHLDLTLNEVPDAYLPGFADWLTGRLSGPLAKELKTLTLSVNSDEFSAGGHQLRIFEALSCCLQLSKLKVYSPTRYSTLAWGGVLAVPASLESLELFHFNIAFDVNAAGEREVDLAHLDRFTQLRTLRVSCMPLPHAAFPSDALWRLAIPTGITRLRELRYLEISAAFGEFREEFGLPPNLSTLSQLSELRIKVNCMASASMAAVAHLPALQVFRLQCGPPCLPVDMAPLARCTTLTSLSVAFDMRHRGIDLDQMAPGSQVPVGFDLALLPQLHQLRLMIFPDTTHQPSDIFQLHFSASSVPALVASHLTLLDLRLANATAVMSLELLGRMAALRQFRVQAGLLDLQPPVNAAGQPTYRGAAGVMAAWAQRLTDLHVRCDRSTPKTAAVLQAFEMVDTDCIFDCRAIAETALVGQQAPPAKEQQHLWKGDVNSAAVAAWGLEA